MEHPNVWLMLLESPISLYRRREIELKMKAGASIPVPADQTEIDLNVVELEEKKLLRAQKLRPWRRIKNRKKTWFGTETDYRLMNKFQRSSSSERSRVQIGCCGQLLL